MLARSPTQWLSELADLVDPAASFKRWIGHAADEWQISVLVAVVRDRVPLLLLLCSRQLGKSSVLAAAAYLLCELVPRTFVLIACPAERQALETFGKLKAFRRSLEATHGADKDTEKELKLRNGSRIVVIPANGRNVRGFSAVDLLLIDEAARVADDDIEALIPALKDTGQLVMASTPFGKKGFFWNAITEQRGLVIRARSVDLPRKAKAVARDRAIMSQRQFEQEHLLAFIGSGECFFDLERFESAWSDAMAPLEL